MQATAVEAPILTIKPPGNTPSPPPGVFNPLKCQASLILTYILSPSLLILLSITLNLLFSRRLKFNQHVIILVFKFFFWDTYWNSNKLNCFCFQRIRQWGAGEASRAHTHQDRPLITFRILGHENHKGHDMIFSAFVYIELLPTEFLQIHYLWPVYLLKLLFVSGMLFTFKPLLTMKLRYWWTFQHVARSNLMFPG